MDIEPEEFRRVTEVTYLGFVNGTRAALRRMLPRDRGVDRAGGLRARPPRHPAAVGLLRRQARHVGVPRVAAHRAAPRPQQRARHVGRHARRQHAPVHLGAVPAAEEGAAGAAVLPARGRGPGGPVRRRPPPAPGLLGRHRHRRHDRRQPRRPAGCSTATSPAPGCRRSRPPRTGRPTSRPTSGTRSTARTAGTSAPTARSTTGPTPRSPQQWSSQHRRELLLAGAGLAAGAALRARRPA